MEKRSEVGAIIKFRANLVDSLGEMPTSRGYLQCLDETGSQKEPILKKANSGQLSREPVPLGGF